MAISLFAALVLSLPLSHAPQAAPRPTGTGTIVGRVVDGVGGQRLSGVTVSIAGGGLPAAEKTVTDADGQFVFRALPAGAFSIGAKRGGYLDGSFGQRRPGGPTRTLKLGDDERRDEVTMELFKPATITGTITDEAGEPVVKVNVRAYRRTFVSGRPVLAEAGTEMTDDRGVYRIVRLLPGDYVVAVPLMAGTPLVNGGTDPGMVRDGGSSAAHLPPSDGKMQKFPTVYYAAGQTAAQATVFTLGIGDIRRNTDVTLRPSRAMNISGTVTMARGVSRGVQMTLIAAGEDEVAGDRAVGTAITGEAGSFSFAGIPSGQYVVRAFARPARASADEAPQWAELVVALNDKDVSDVALYMRLGSKVGGRIEMDAASDDRGTPASGLTLSLDPASTRYAGGPLATATVDPASKTFAFANILPGRYLLRVGGTSNRAVKSITYQGRDVWLTPFTLDASDINGIVVTLTDHPTVIAGTVTGTGDIGESRVLVFPQDPQAWTDFGKAAALRLLDVTVSGTFEVRGLPAGDYWLAAFDQDADVDWQNPAFLQAAARFATRARLGDSERQSVDLKIVTIK